MQNLLLPPNEKKAFNYTFKLVNPITRINLPYAIDNVSKLKVLFVSYKTASANNKILMIKISQFNSNVYFDGVDIIKYAKIIALPPSASTPIMYDNLFEHSDVLREPNASNNTGISNLTIELLIDNVYSGDIAGGNPVFIELKIE